MSLVQMLATGRNSVTFRADCAFARDVTIAPIHSCRWDVGRSPLKKALMAARSSSRSTRGPYL